MRIPKSIDKYLGQEDRTHIACANWLNMSHPSILWIHVPNEGKRKGYVSQYKIKAMGVKSGFPDFFICEPRGKYSGAMIELKVIYPNGKKNYPSKSQKEWIDKLREMGYYTTIVWSLDEFIEEVTNYLFNNEE